MRKRTMTKRFYVGSQSMTEGQNNHHFLRASVGEAVEEARKRLLAYPHYDEVYIVEVIKVVRRENPPIVVEDVRR